MVAVRSSLGSVLHAWNQTWSPHWQVEAATLDLAAVLQPKVRTDIPCGLRRASDPAPNIDCMHPTHVCLQFQDDGVAA